MRRQSVLFIVVCLCLCGVVFMFLHPCRHLKGFQSFLPKHGRISEISTEAREGLSDSGLRKFSPLKRGRVILTLDPNKLVEKKQQCLHIGNLQSFRPHISLLKHSSPVWATGMYYHRSYGKKGAKLTYPPGLKAFLYYYMSPKKPRIAAELRLRVTSNEDAESFESGSDLLGSNGQPWSRPLLILPKYYFPLYEKLREEGFVPDDLDRVLTTMPSNTLSFNNPRYSNSRRYLYTINDTFIVDFSIRGPYLFAITEKGFEKMPFIETFLDGREKCNSSPFSGSALVRFERSSLLEHKGTRTVVLRFLKIITPVECVMPNYDGYICCPKEGELHRRGQKVWCVNIDKLKGPKSIVLGLRLLWDAPYLTHQVDAEEYWSFNHPEHDSCRLNHFASRICNS